MKTRILLGVLGLAIVMWAAPAVANHNGPARGEPGLHLDADIGERAWGAWLWGESGPGGPRLEGRLEGGGRPLDFTLDAREIRELFERWLPRR